MFFLFCFFCFLFFSNFLYRNWFEALEIDTNRYDRFGHSVNWCNVIWISLRWIGTDLVPEYFNSDLFTTFIAVVLSFLFHQNIIYLLLYYYCAILCLWKAPARREQNAWFDSISTDCCFIDRWPDSMGLNLTSRFIQLRFRISTISLLSSNCCLS